uniref:B9 domain-containing protein 2 n=1 Tax=Romanomermis culicivorax TaxID=13658 RepID=A0A915HLJ4_ROMCU
MAELYVIGQILGAKSFPDKSLFCRWKLHFGGGWTLVEGRTEGQTQTDSPDIGHMSCFSHPIDVHLVTRSLQGWPKIQLQIWHLDQFSRQELYGYGVCYVPTLPGSHDLECGTWRPVGTLYEETMHKFLGGGILLKNPDAAASGVEDRYKLNTSSMGSVHLRLNVIMRNFDKFGVECY